LYKDVARGSGFWLPSQPVNATHALNLSAGVSIPPCGANWYRYVIAFEGTNTIHGRRQGGLKAVTRAVEEIIAKLNERRLTNPRRVNRLPTPKKKTHK